MRDMRAAQLLFHGERLGLARRWRGLTKRELAASVGVTPAAISQYEAGQSRPRAETLGRLALAVQLPPAFFGRRPSASRLVEEEWHFRSLRATRKRDRDRVLAKTAVLANLIEIIDRYVELPQVDLPEHVVDHLTSETIEFATARVRTTWDLGEGPIDTMIGLLEGRGCVVSSLDAGTDDLDAFSGWVGKRPFVVLATNKDDAERSRFDAAHELGHLLLHHDVNAGSRTAELQANVFASAFLMPRNAIAAELPPRLDFSAYFDLKLRWRVSVAALIYRARQVGRLTEPSFRRAMTELSANGWRRQEPLAGECERPTVVADALDLLWSSRGLSRDQIAADLQVTRVDLDSLVEASRRGPTPPERLRERMSA